MHWSMRSAAIDLSRTVRPLHRPVRFYNFKNGVLVPALVANLRMPSPNFIALEKSIRKGHGGEYTRQIPQF